MIIEVTASSVTYGTAMSGDFEAIKRELRKILFKASPERKARGKIPQLNETVQAVRNEAIRCIPCKKITEIFPILLLERGLPWVPGIVHNYQGMIRESGISDECFSRFQIMDLEELEAVEAAMEKKGVALAELLRSKFHSEWRPWPVKNFLMFNQLWFGNKRVHAQWDRIVWDSGLVFGRGPRQILEFCKIKWGHLISGLQKSVDATAKP